MRNSRRDHKAGDASPSFASGQRFHSKPLPFDSGPGFGLVIPTYGLGATRFESLGGRPSGSTHPKDSNPPTGKFAYRDHRTLRVARPIRARISEMIQKRITICGSAQPSFSK